MAITFVGAGAIAVGLSGANPAAPYPAGLQANDRLVLVVVNGPATEPSTQTGFTKAIGGLSGSGSQSPAGAIYHKAATGSESGNFTVTNNTAGTCRAILLAYRGVDTGTPIDVAATEASIGAVTAYTVPGQTASVVGVTFVGFTVANSATGTMTPPTVPAAWAERVDSIADSPHTSAADLVAWSGSGASGDFNFVRSAAVRGYAAVIALRPAGSGSTVNGTAAGTQAGTSSATATRTVNASGSGTQAGSASVSATRTVNGTAAGTGAGSSSATTTRTVHATATGTQAGAGSATGTVSGGGTVDATATGTQAGAAAAVGTRTVNATATGTNAGAGSATGLRLVNGTGTGSQNGTANAVALRIVNGTASGTQTGAGTAVGEAVGDHVPADPSRTILVRHEPRTLTVDDPSRTLLVRVEPRTLTA